ncbi:PBSX family phage terminase large subunit [Anaerotruncus sp. AF02-27]|uniref:PBSX family phage terminase large subunit n=1 Tax=Anaerotruncus TaxID=244127 RepID=UPI000E525A89|nr:MULTISPECIES: PBSX family phage terminase large subunit [Anaerotruncus]RGX55157.1 PBSX family phage terminase large subunit [Anaerotruncus sp. AF02-27]
MPEFSRFSKKQLAAMTWWHPQSPHHGRGAIICDGAVRSGKTLCLSIGFTVWAMSCFSGQDFALCGKTAGGLRRNLITPLLSCLPALGYACSDRRSRGYLEISYGRRMNRFYLFGGRDESSAALIQGVTLAGVLLDEVALMPRSFVEQALARCSTEGARFWFSCNPEYPQHWFYREWIQKAAEKNALYLHFTMRDNPSLSPAVLQRYENLYAGAFYERFVLGKWVAAQGAVYPMFDESAHVVKKAPVCGRFFISCDYGTVNPASFGLWGEHAGVWYRLAEYYHDSRVTGELRTDEEYHQALMELAGGRKIEAVIVDPSAASFLACIRRHGVFRAIPAKNEVADGIRMVSSLLKEQKLLFCAGCRDTIREFSLYRWDNRAGKDQPFKEHDHAMDDIRYFVMTALVKDTCPFFAASVSRADGLRGHSDGFFG